MTTLVPTSEEDPALSVVRFTSEISWADAGPEVPTLPLYNQVSIFIRFCQIVKFQLRSLLYNLAVV